jgi:hypothetical protein
VSEPKYKIVDETPESPAVVQIHEKTPGSDAEGIVAAPDRSSSVCPSGYETPSPTYLRRSAAYGRRDGVDSFLGATEWILRLRNTGQSNPEREQFYEKYRQSELAFWREFQTPTDKISAEWIAKTLREIWTFPPICGRQWADATLCTARQELGIDIGGSL